MKELMILFILMISTFEVYAEIPVGKWFGMKEGRAFHLSIELDGSSELVVSDFQSSPTIHRSPKGSVEERNSTYQIVYESREHVAKTILSFSAWQAPDNPCCKLSGYIHSASIRQSSGEKPQQASVVGGHEILLDELNGGIHRHLMEYARAIGGRANNSIQPNADASAD